MKLLASSQATIMQATPTTWRLLIEAGWSGRKLKVLCGGEALPQELARRLTARCQSVWNVYGPTETTIWSAIHRVQSNNLAPGVQPIGHPIANTEFYVLDTGGRLVPIGIPGELYIGGDGLARGYFNRQQETEARFISHPFSSVPGARLYRTGDLVRYRDNGDLEFLGRMDSQVKVRGFRIELGDVETALAACPGIKGAVAVVRHEGLGHAQLVGYVIPHAGQGVTPDEVRQFAKAKLPEYMVPGQIAFLDTFPLTPNGKVDRKALPAPDWQPPRKEYVAPRSELEGKLVKAWEATLDRNPIGIRDDFFALGGHSLLGARLMHRLEQAGVKLSMAALFTAPTVEKMAALIAAEVPEKRSPAQMIPLQPAGSRPPFFCICVGTWPMYRPLLSRLDQDQPFFGLDLEPSLAHKLSPPYTIRAVAEHLAARVRQQQPEGPYYLGGYCMSGILAYETAQVLLAQGHKVGLLAMFLAYNPAPNSLFSHRTQAGLLVRRVTLRKIREHVGNLWKTQGGKEPTQYLHSRAADFMRDLKSLLWQMSFTLRSHFSGGRLSDVREILYCAAKQFRPEPYPGRVALFRSMVEGSSEITRDPLAGWGEVTRRLLICRVPGDDIEIFDEPNVDIMAQELDTCLLKAFAEENTADEVCIA
jgi:thioesterase domain-containing protein/aryl carrier-like protein